MAYAWSDHVAYCGFPPQPTDLWTRWNLDPVLILLLAVGAIAYGVGARRLRACGLQGPPHVAQVSFHAGWALGALALVSPLCALSVSLFAARVGQHMALTLVAAPLVAFGRPFQAWRALWRPSPRAEADRHPLAAAAVFTGLIWFWHAPAPYGWTFLSTPVYWAMHLSLIGSALWLWSGLLDPARGRMARAIAAGLGSTVQMSLLGAIITLSSAPLFAPHALTTMAYGLTPLEDQQLGGAIMWAPGCLAFLAAAMWSLSRLLDRDGARAAAAPSGARG